MTDGYNFLRLLHTRYSESEYVTECWTPINDCLQELLQSSLDDFPSRSYPTVYCQIYKTTCKGYAERLFDDVKKIILEYSQARQQQLNENLTNITKDPSITSNNNYIGEFLDHLQRFHQTMETIVPLFHYLDVVYIKPKLKSTIQHELLLIYKRILLEIHLPHIFFALKQSISTSEKISKERIGLFLEMTHDITPESMIEQRDFFQRYCNSEDVIHNEEIPSRTTSKRSVDHFPDDEDQPAAKRPMPTTKSPHYHD